MRSIGEGRTAMLGALRGDRGAVRRTVDAQREAGDDDDAGARQLVGDLGRDRHAVAGRAARPDDRDGTLLEGRLVADDEQRRRPRVEGQQRRRVRPRRGR